MKMKRALFCIISMILVISANMNFVTAETQIDPVQLPYYVDADHTSIIVKKLNGEVWGWGHARHGRLLMGNLNEVVFDPTHIRIEDYNFVKTKLAFGNSTNPFIIALRDDGTLWGWGCNWQGLFHPTDNISILEPRQIDGFENIVDFEFGGTCLYALKSDGTLWVKGLNKGYSLGIGSQNESYVLRGPMKINGLGNVEKMWASIYSNSVFVRLDDSSIWGWGDNGYGQMGTGDKIRLMSPTYIGAFQDAVEIAMTRNQTFVLRSDGTVEGCGYNGYELLGGGISTPDNTSTELIPMLNVDNAIQLSGGYEHLLILEAQGDVKALGYNDEAQIGDGTMTRRSIATQITTLDNVVSVYAGYKNSFAVKEDGSLWGWGQGGTILTSRQSRPVFIMYLWGGPCDCGCGCGNPCSEEAPCCEACDCYEDPVGVHTVTIVEHYLDGALPDHTTSYSVEDGGTLVAPYDILRTHGVDSYMMRSMPSYIVNEEEQTVTVRNVDRDLTITLNFDRVAYMVTVTERYGDGSAEDREYTYIVEPNGDFLHNFEVPEGYQLEIESDPLGFLVSKLRGTISYTGVDQDMIVLLTYVAGQ